MLGGVGDRLSGDGWPAGCSGRGPGWPKGTLGGMGASFLETEGGNRQDTGLSDGRHPRGRKNTFPSPPTHPQSTPGTQAARVHTTDKKQARVLPTWVQFPTPSCLLQAQGFTQTSLGKPAFPPRLIFSRNASTGVKQRVSHGLE